MKRHSAPLSGFSIRRNVNIARAASGYQTRMEGGDLLLFCRPRGRRMLNLRPSRYRSFRQTRLWFPPVRKWREERRRRVFRTGQSRGRNCRSSRW